MVVVARSTAEVATTTKRVASHAVGFRNILFWSYCHALTKIKLHSEDSIREVVEFECVEYVKSHVVEGDTAENTKGCDCVVNRRDNQNLDVCHYNN